MQQATELSAHFARVKSVFAEGDLQRIAATLASIRQGLALVGNVPEFRGGSAKLAVGCASFPAVGSINFSAEQLPSDDHNSFLGLLSVSGACVHDCSNCDYLILCMYLICTVHADLGTIAIAAVTAIEYCATSWPCFANSRYTALLRLWRSASMR